MKLTQIIKKLESEYGWSFYDESKKLHITEMQKELILDVARVVEQNCNKHGVVRPASASALEGEPLPAEGSAKSVSGGPCYCKAKLGYKGECDCSDEDSLMFGA